MTASEFVRQTVLERIETEYDLHIYEEALSKFMQDPVTYSLDEVEQELGIKERDVLR